MEAVDTIAFLAGSEPRAAVLASLYRDGVLDRGELAARGDAARVTVGRNLEKLQKRGLVSEVSAGYELTALGGLLAEGLLAMAETVSLADQLTPVLRQLPPEAFDFDLRALDGAEVTASTRADPYAPVSRHERTLEAASEARLVVPAVGDRPMATVSNRVADGDLQLELLVSADVESTLHSSGYRDSLERILDADGGSVRTCEAPVPYYLGLVDETVQVGVDDDGIPRALLESDDTSVRSWAEEGYRAYRSESEPFEWAD